MSGKKKHLIYPLFLPMQGCPHRCIYCDQNKLSGATDFDVEAAVAQVNEYVQRNAVREKQVAFYGGTFTALDFAFRTSLLDRMLAVSDAQTSFRISTHPLYIDADILAWCRDKRIRTIELGIQDFDDSVLSQSGRGYTGNQAMAAAKLIQDGGFELGVQLMPGLPGWTESSIQANHTALEELKPNLLRLYPLIVIKGTTLAILYAAGKYLPLTLDEAVRQCADYFPLAERNGIRIIKLGIPTNIDTEDILAGPWHPTFGELVKTHKSPSIR